MLDYVVLEELKGSSKASRFSKNRKKKDCAGHPGFFCRSPSDQKKYAPIPGRGRAGSLEEKNIESTTLEPLALERALQRVDGRLLFLPETSDDDTENAEDLDVLLRGDSPSISDASTCSTYSKPNRNTHKRQFRDKSTCTFDSDDMSVFTSNESLVYGQFPNSFMTIVDEDDES